MVRCAPTPMVKAWVDSMPINVKAPNRTHFWTLVDWRKNMKLKYPTNPVKEISIGSGKPSTQLTYGRNMNMPPTAGKANNAMLNGKVHSEPFLIS